MQKPFPEGHSIFNIGSGRPLSIKEIASKINDILDKKTELEWGAIPHRKNEIWFMEADTRKARKTLNWFARTSIDEGIRSTIEWFKETIHE